MYIATNFCFIMFPPMCAILVQAPSATNFRFLETCDWLMASVNNADLSRNVPAKFMQFPLAQGQVRMGQELHTRQYWMIKY